MPDPVLIVPDVNVFVSGTSIAQGPPAQIMQAWHENRLGVATSEPILKDLRRVLNYPKVQHYTRMTPQETRSYLQFIQATATVVPGTTPVAVSSDPDDDKLFACALEAQADYLVSGDEKHVLSVGTYQGIQTLSPRQLVDTVLQPLKRAA
jgi:uncharacterized protein